jgi:cytochrome c peroxidase
VAAACAPLRRYLGGRGFISPPTEVLAMMYVRTSGTSCTRGRKDFARRRGAPVLLVVVVVALVAAGPVITRAEDDVRRGHGNGAPPTVFDSPDPAGVLRTAAVNGNTLDPDNPFFQSLGSNGRTCASCHVPTAAWTITPAEVRERFERTDGLDPIFRTNDGSNSPRARVGTLAERRAAFGMLLNKAVIRVGLPIPAGAEFELAAVDDPYGYASAAELSLFRRPLPSTNLRFLTGVMWDGRESYGPFGTAPIRADGSVQQNFDALFADLMHQANGATTGHAQGAPLSAAQQEAIARFELNLSTAQVVARRAGALDVRGTPGGPLALASQPFYVTINDALEADVQTGRFDSHAMTLFDGWRASPDPNQAAIARGAAIFGQPRMDVTGVGGLNDDLGLATIRASCTTCHDTPNVGNHSVALPIDIGLTDKDRRTPDMPLYTLRNLATGQTRQTTDPGRALLTGRWNDIGKFKGPVLRGLAARPPYFHNGSAADLGEVLDFYRDRFGLVLTDQERSDLIAFLDAL